MDTKDQINKLYEGLKLSNVVYTISSNIASFSFLYNPNVFALDDDKKNVIRKKILEIMGADIPFNISFTKCTIDEEVLISYIYTALLNNFPAISKNLQISDITVKISGNDVTANIRLHPSIYGYATEAGRQNDVARKLEDNFTANFAVVFSEKNDGNGADFDDNEEYQNSIRVLEQKNLYNIEDAVNIIGKCDYSIASDFSAIDREMDDVVICGVIKFINKRTYKKQQTINGEKVEVEKNFYNILLTNENKSINCSVFPHKNEGSLLDEFLPGKSIAMKGNFSAYKDRLNFTANSLCLCNFSKVEHKIQYKDVNEHYHTVFPFAYEDAEQVNLLSEKEAIDMPGTYVVFDTETTGLHAEIDDELIEIGAVKVENGTITQIFSTLIKPSKSIPAEASAINHIYDDDVRDAPSVVQVIPDFYKFCHGADLVAHNIEFDIGFIKKFGSRQGYNFNHKCLDTLAIAKEKLKGLKNYKLGTICEYLGIDIGNAHRAYFDALATAKVLIKLNKN